MPCDKYRSANSDQASGSVGRISSSWINAVTASGIRPNDRSSAIRRFVMGYPDISTPIPLNLADSNTHNIRAVIHQYILVLLQHRLQISSIACISLLDQTLERHDLLVLVAETAD